MHAEVADPAVVARRITAIVRIPQLPRKSSKLFVDSMLSLS
jgi:hypothetical protein